MGLTIYRESDANLDVLKDKTVGVIGYGNQGRAHALNLRDSGLTVTVGQRRGPSFERAVADGFAPIPVQRAAADAELVIVTLPDETAADIYTESIRSSLGPGKTLGFVHGFNIRFGLIDSPDGVDVIMVAPKGPGSLLRSLYEQGRGLPSLVAVASNPSGQALATALAWAAGIGSTRAGVVQTTFAAETETDLFGEQAVLCGGVTALMRAAFETLVDAGYEPEFAYIECVHELKQTVDLIYEAGLTGMRSRISNTAEYGDLTRGPRMINEDTRREMRKVLGEIRSGRFAREWMDECAAGKPRFRELLAREADSEFEKAGHAVRQLMPWLTEEAG